MENLETSIKIPSGTNMLPSSVEDSSALFEDNASRTCPLCHSEVRLFFINFNDKMMMCENTQCDFPFGYEELQFVKEDNEKPGTAELESSSITSKTHTRGTATCSVVSDEAWFEIDKVNRAYESEDSQQFEPKALDPKEFINYTKGGHVKDKSVKKQTNIKEKMENLQQINIKMREIKKPQTYIKDENYLKTLMQLQGNTSLLRPEEEMLLQKNKPVDTCQVRFEVKKDNCDMTAIKIEFNTPNPV